MKLISEISILFLWIILQSCGSVGNSFYMQSPHNVPLFKEKNELNINGLIPVGDVSNGRSVQSSYSFAKNFGAFVSYFDFENSRNEIHNNVKGNWWKGKYKEIAIGYFNKFKTFGQWELFAGYGNGSQNNSFTEITGENNYIFWTNYLYENVGNSKISYNKFFIQPTFAYSNKFFDMAFSLRLTDLYLYNVENNVSKGKEYIKDVEQLQVKRNYFLFEPGFCFRLGYEYLKFQFQFGYTRNNAGKYFDRDGNYYGLGVLLHIPFSKKNTK